MATRNFTEFINLVPGVDDGNRAGNSDSTGGGSNNFMMDGVGTMEPGSNRLMVAVNTESIAQVKVLTSSYQAEFGRSSGLQVTAVTRSGTNRFRGSVYDVERNSDWYSNSKTNLLNGDPKTTLKQRDWGFSVGGPVGQARRPEQAVLLLRAGVPAARAGQQRDSSPLPDRSRAARRLLGDDGQQRQPVAVHSRLPDRRDVQQCRSHRVLRRRRRARQDSRRSPVSDRPEHPQPVPAAEPDQHPGRAELQLRDHAAESAHYVLPARR